MCGTSVGALRAPKLAEGGQGPGGAPSDVAFHGLLRVWRSIRVRKDVLKKDEALTDGIAGQAAHHIVNELGEDRCGHVPGTLQPAQSRPRVGSAHASAASSRWTRSRYWARAANAPSRSTATNRVRVFGADWATTSRSPEITVATIM